MKTEIDKLPLIVAIEEASGLTFEQIEADSVEPWITLYNEEVERMENENVEFKK